MRRVLFAFTGIAAAVFIMAIGGVDNVVRSQSSLPAPTGVSAVNGDNHGEAVVSWQAVADAAYYRIGWMADEDYQAAGGAQGLYQEWLKEFRYSNVVNRGQPSRAITRLTPGIKYWIIVGSHDAFYGGPQWSSWAEVTLDGGPNDRMSSRAKAEPHCPIIRVVTVSGCQRLKYQAVDAGKNHTCGIKLDNTLECWGDNISGADQRAGRPVPVRQRRRRLFLRDRLREPTGLLGPRGDSRPRPTATYTHVSVGDEHACAITVAAGNKNRIDLLGLGSITMGRTANLAQHGSSGSYDPWT